jgi:hypothetical protein
MRFTQKSNLNKHVANHAAKPAKRRRRKSTKLSPKLILI